MRVLIADDHEVVRRGVRSLLSDSDVDVCGEAVDGRDAVERASELKPDVIVMDVSMPNLNGLEATRLIRGLFPEIEVVILSQHNSPEMIRQAFNAGARGYVVKSAVADHLAAAVESVARHQSFGADNPDESLYVDPHEVLQRAAALEHELRDSEERFRATFEQAAVGIAHIAADGRFLRINQRYSEIAGYTKAELLRLRIQDLTHPDDLAAETTENDKVLAGASDCYSLDKRAIRKDGSLIWVSRTVSAVRDASGQVKYLISVIEDITQRKQFDQVQCRLAAIVESSDDAIVSKDLDGTITSWNAGAQRMFGFSPEEAIGRSINLIIPFELRNEEKEILRRLRIGQRIDHFETVRHTKNGSQVHVSLTISPMRDSQGRIIGASKIARDITERKRAEEALKESELSARLLQVQDEDRRRIARELHDGVGQLLSAVNMNAATVAEEKAKLSPKAARCVEENAKLIEQVSAEIRTTSYLLHPPLLDEMGLLHALKWYVEGFAERSKISVALELPPDLGRLPKERELSLFRVVQECLTNVHRHSGSSTALVRLTRASTQITLEVKDDGVGIDRETQARIATGRGSGLGLRGMRERAARIGGKLELQSNGNGTSIVVVLPAAPQLSQAAEAVI